MVFFYLVAICSPCSSEVVCPLFFWHTAIFWSNPSPIPESPVLFAFWSAIFVDVVLSDFLFKPWEGSFQSATCNFWDFQLRSMKSISDIIALRPSFGSAIQGAELGLGRIHMLNRIQLSTLICTSSSLWTIAVCSFVKRSTAAAQSFFNSVQALQRQHSVALRKPTLLRRIRFQSKRFEHVPWTRSWRKKNVNMRCRKQKSMKSCTRQCSETSTCTKPRGHFARVLTISKETLALERHLRHQKEDSLHLERRLPRRRQTNASRGSLGRFCRN